MNDEISKTIYSLITKQPFLSYMAYNMARITNTEVMKKIGSFAAITFINNKSCLYIHPEIFNSFDLSSRQFIICHELYHVLLEHFFRRTDKDHHIFNIACDLAINSIIKTSFNPIIVNKEVVQKIEKLMTFEYKFVKTQIKNNEYRIAILPEDFEFPNNLCAEEYYNLLLKKGYTPRTKIKITCSNGSVKTVELKDLIYNNLEFIEDLIAKGSSPEIIKEEIKRLIRQAIDEIQKNQGNISSELQDLINKIFTVRVNWKSILRNFIQFSTRFFLKRNTKKINKRYPDFIFPGIKNIPKLKILVGHDASGSVEPRETQEFYGQMDYLLTLGNDIWYFIGDSQIIKEPAKYSRNIIPKQSYGGTDPNPWLKQIENFDCDIGVIFTDGEFNNDLIKIKKPVLFVVTRKENFQNISNNYKKVLLELNNEI